jgi:luciferase family oxidoreductase group 1
LIAHVGAATERIRLGAGGVMLPNHSPLKVAESYRLLEAMHPGRIDLGLGRAPGTDPITALALRRTHPSLAAGGFEGQLAELVGYTDGSIPSDHPFSAIRAMPDDVPLPPIWLLGSSDHSARLAAELGVGFAFAAHFSPEPAEGPMRLYRERFVPGPLARPHAILALAVFCAETREEATRIASSIRVTFAQLRTGTPGRLPSPDEALAYPFTPEERASVAYLDRLQILGTPPEVKSAIEAAVARTGADEAMLATHAFDPAARQRSYELIARVFALDD